MPFAVRFDSRRARVPLSRILFVLLLAPAASGGCARVERLLFEGFNRDKWQMPSRVIAELDLRPGQAVADLGSGPGYFTMLLAQAVGPEGRVIALDVDGDSLSELEARAGARNLKNIQTVRVRGTDPGLPPRAFDLIFICNTYYLLKHPVKYFADLRNHLAPRGRIAVLEFRPDDWRFRWFGNATPGPIIVEELRQAGYRVEKNFDFLPRQTFVIFAPEP